MPAKRRILPYGTWPSPIGAALAARGSSRIGMVQAGGDAIYWSESRPEEQGRQAIVRVGPDGRREDVLPEPYSARSRVHEYGGGEFLVAGDTLYFVNDKDQQVYTLAPGGRPCRITEAPRTRFADFVHDFGRGRLIAVAEMHAEREAGEHAQPANALVAIPLDGEDGEIEELVSGRDFYASPRLSADGGRLAFLAWDLPDMPWDSATLFVAPVRADGSLGPAGRIAGGDGSAVFQPEWGPDGHLYFVWDKNGWGSLCRWNGKRVALVRRSAGADLFRPQWILGSRCFSLHPNGRFAAAFTERGLPLLETGNLAGEVTAHRPLQKKAARIDELVPFGTGFAALVHSPLAMPAVMRLERGTLRAVAKPTPAAVGPGCISAGRSLGYRSAGGRKAYGIHYAPTNPGYRGPQGARPPAIILVHGGPTSMTDAGLKMRLQFYTSRGFAVFDVNYAGSTGYGRAYRQRLDGQWGIADVADCAAAARFLAKQGLADADKIAITGGSAGGYTTLMALATTKAFAAGSSHFGVSDLALLMEHTHKFESGYLHCLLGTTPAKWREVCAARSPINLIDGITAPIILFQGLDDRVVPPEQSRLIVEKLRARGIEVAYHEFAGEAHGFRRADTIIAVLEAELAFLRQSLRLG